MWFLSYVILPVLLNIIAGLVSGYYVARTFEFRDIRNRACFALRPFAAIPEVATQTLTELYMCRDQLLSLGFPSVEPTFSKLIAWAEQHCADRTTEVADKRHNYMPRLEGLRFTFAERLCLARRKGPNQTMQPTASPRTASVFDD